METTLIVGAFVVVGITAVAISTFSDKVKNALNFKAQEGVYLPPGLATRMYDGEEEEDEEEDRSVDRGGRRSRKKSRKK
jgi:hypothetical protein